MNERISLEEVLNDFGFEAGEKDPRSVLNKFVKEFPQFSEELTEFAASQSIQKYAPETDLTAEEEENYRDFGVRQLRAFLKKKPAAISSLHELAKEQGMNKRAFAEALGITVSLLTYLEKRRLRFATIPAGFIRRISEKLQTTEEAVAAFLEKGPMLPPSAPRLSAQISFMAAERPQDQEPKDFFEAVAEDPGLTEAQKQELSGLE